MSVKCSDIMNIMEKIAPIPLAEKWDNVGLQVGDENKQIKKIMIALELNNEITDEAVKEDVDMIITHHPLIYKPLNKLISSDPIVKILNKLIKNDINLYTAHTNLDVAIGGTSDYLAQLLKLKDICPLRETYNERYYKLAVFIPEKNLEDVREAISLAGGGHIGNYSHCTFQSKGIGTFKPLEGSNPYIGSLDKIERVDEYRLEVIVSQDKLKSVIKAMKSAHPYEEVAYDLIPLENKISSLGLGRIGYLKEAKTLKTLALEVKSILKAQKVRVVGNELKSMNKIAICTGSGSDYIKDAYINKCDCYITGDIKYHDAQLAAQLGLTIIDAGHYETENIICTPLKERLLNEFERYNYKIRVIVSETDINPFSII